MLLLRVPEVCSPNLCVIPTQAHLAMSSTSANWRDLRFWGVRNFRSDNIYKHVITKVRNFGQASVERFS